MNLLDLFILKHIQVSRLNAELTRVSKEPGNQEAKVELNLTPRPVKTDSGDDLPSYQVSARLSCRGGGKDQPGPTFSARVGIEAVYQQINGDPMDLSEFTNHHASLTRQLYPLLQQELRQLLIRLGLEQIHLPFDLAARVSEPDGESIYVSGSLH
jgi:hypothetical protein